MSCKENCNKPVGCTCSCENDEIRENCNNCVNQDSIVFSGLCNSNNFSLKDSMWKEFDISGTILVPDNSYSIEELDSINVNVEIISKKLIKTPKSDESNLEGKKVTGYKLIVKGLLCFNISYVALVPEQSVHTFHGQVPFSTFIVLPAPIDIDKPNDYIIDSCVEELCIKQVCERSILIGSSLILKAKPIPGGCNGQYLDKSGLSCNGDIGFSGCSENDCFNEKAVITGVCPSYIVEDMLEDGDDLWTEISIPEVLNIPSLKPDILQVLTVTSRFEIMCQKIIETPSNKDRKKEIINNGNLTLTGFKLLIFGVLKQRITYTSNTECKSVHSAHYDYPVCTYIVLPLETDFSDKFEIDSCIEDINACALNNRQIFKSTTLFLKATKIDCEG